MSNLKLSQGLYHYTDEGLTIAGPLALFLEAEGVLELFIRNCLAHSIRAHEPGEVISKISRAFTWSQAEGGLFFWNELNQKFEGIGISKEFPASPRDSVSKAKIGELLKEIDDHSLQLILRDILFHGSAPEDAVRKYRPEEKSTN